MRNVEVNDLQKAILANKHILRLDIPVHDIVLMHWLNKEVL